MSPRGLKIAKEDAESSPTLCHLAAPFDQASSTLSGLTDKIKSGNVSSQDMDGLASKIDAVQTGAKTGGVEAPDQVPSDSQLTSGAS